MDDIFVIYVMWMMCYICEICVVEAGNINKNKKMLSGLFVESRALGKSASLPRAYLSANLPLCQELGGRLLANLFFCLKTTSAANLFF